jgi:hypothetical protein
MTGICFMAHCSDIEYFHYPDQKITKIQSELAGISYEINLSQ